MDFKDMPTLSIFIACVIICFILQITLSAIVAVFGFIFAPFIGAMIMTWYLKTHELTIDEDDTPKDYL